MKADLAQRSHEARAEFVEFASMIAGEPAQKLTAFGRDVEKGTALVFSVGFAREQALAHGAIDELNSRVVAQAEAFGGVGDGDRGSGGRAGDLKEKLVLLGLQAGLGGRGFTEVQEAA